MKNEILDLSEEYVFTCDSKDHECFGGDERHAFSVYQTLGVPDEECDIYTGKPEDCPVVNCTKSFISGIKDVGSNEDDYAAVVHQYGPVTLSIKVPKSIWYYSNGTMEPDEQCAHSADHVVVLVGFTPEVWIIRNSWGPGFGDGGYFYVKRGINWCGMTQEVTLPYLSDTEPTDLVSIV